MKALSGVFASGQQHLRIIRKECAGKHQGQGSEQGALPAASINFNFYTGF